MPVCEDDLSIANEDLLWRRIVNGPIWLKIRDDGTFRLSSAAFKDDYTGEVSVHLGKIMLRSQKALEGRPDDGLVEIEAGIPRAHKHKVACDPTPEDDSHAVICPLEGLSGNGRSKAAKLIAKKVKWLVFPKILREMGHAV